MKTLILILGVALFLGACSTQSIKQDLQTTAVETPTNTLKLTDEQMQMLGIQLGRLTSQTISSTFKTNGKVDVPPQNLISVTVPLAGYVKSVNVLNGMQVKKGQVLAILEDMQYIQLQQDYLTAKTQLILTESEYQRQQSLKKRDITSEKIFEQADANYQTQLILVKSLAEKLKLIGLSPQNFTADNISRSISICSPVNGFVSAVNVNVGRYVNTGDVLLEIIDPSDIHVKLTVFEKDIDKLAVGQKLVAYTNANPDKKYKGEIILISKTLSIQNAGEVHCHFEQYDKTLLPGTFMNAEIQLVVDKASVLPQEAVVRFENKHYVFLATLPNTFQMCEVRVGYTQKGYTQIINQPDTWNNQQFAVKGAYQLLMALKNSAEE